MADISLNRTHSLGLKGAHAAANKMAEKLGEKFALTSSWVGNTMNFTRQGLNGTLAISESDIKLEVTLGFMLKMMKGPIEQSVHEQLDKALGKPGTKPTPKPAFKTATASKAPVAKKPAAKVTAKKK